MATTGLPLSERQRRALDRAVDEDKVPCYVYVWDDIVERVEAIEAAFHHRFELSYAVKANPNPVLLERLEKMVGFLDVSSAGELDRGLAAGYAAERISFSGPAKTADDLQHALDSGCKMLIVENAGELIDLERMVRDRDRPLAVILRVNPSRIPKGFGVNMAGRPCQFGFDEEDLDDVIRALQAKGILDIRGFHAYAGTQCLDADAIVENLGNYVELFRSFSDRHRLQPELLVFGSGIGIPYHAGDDPVDLSDLGARAAALVDRMRETPRLARSRCLLELGRLLVGEAGFYLTRVVRTKRSRGKTIGICDGGLNHHLAACGHFGSVIHRNFRIASLAASRERRGADAIGRYDLFGPLCTTIDQLARDVELPGLEVGDVIAIGSSGAYGLTASPINFISHPPPRELLATGQAEALSLEDVG